MTAAGVSVVIVSRDRPEQLAACLRALGGQRGDVAELELLVVDDGSEREEAAIAAAAGIPGVRVLRRPPRGVGAARNAGGRAARFEHVCFTDDDCVPHPGWVARLAAQLEGGAEVVAGPTVEDGCDLARALQLTADALIDRDAAAKGSTAFAPGSNFACRRSVLERFPLDETLAGIGAEDRDWCARLAAAGIAVAFEPDAVVLHERRVTLRSFLSKNVRYGRGAWRHRVRHEHGRLEPPRFYAELIRSGFAGGVPLGAAVAFAQAAIGTGYVLEALSAGRSGDS